MPEYKHTIFINGVTNSSDVNYGKRSWGISESLYASQAYDASNNSPLDLLMRARAQLLPRGASIVGFRVSKIGVRNSSVSHGKTYPGVWENKSDYPTLAILAKKQTEDGNVLKMILRGLADGDTEEGEWSLGSGLDTRFKSFRRYLAPFYSKVIDLNAVSADISHIDENGLVTTMQDHGLQKDDKVFILRSKGSLRGNYNGLYKVSLAPTLRTFSVYGWEGGLAQYGRTRKHGIVNAPYGTDMQAERIIQRKVGKPNFSFAGRR